MCVSFICQCESFRATPIWNKALTQPGFVQRHNLPPFLMNRQLQRVIITVVCLGNLGVFFCVIIQQTGWIETSHRTMSHNHAADFTARLCIPGLTKESCTQHPLTLTLSSSVYDSPARALSACIHRLGKKKEKRKKDQRQNKKGP